VERELLPAGAVRAAVLDLVLAQRSLVHVLRSRALGAEPAARDGARRIALDLRDRALLDVDQLGAADGAEGADRVDDVVGVVYPRLQRAGALGAGGLAQPERITLPKLAQERPVSDPFVRPHA